MIQKVPKVKSIIILFWFLLVISSCTNSCSSTNSSPEALAKEICDCYKELQSYKNTSKRAEKLDECTNLIQQNLSRLNRLGIDNDWTDEQVKDARKRFDDITDKCWH